MLATLDRTDAVALFRELPLNRVGEADRRYVAEVLQEGFGNWESARMLERFEAAFAERLGVRFAISHNSGSGTLLSSLLAAGVGPGDEVIVPSLTMAATAFVVVQCGAVPVFADCDTDTFTIDVADVSRKVSDYTKAIIPVSIYGLPVDFDGLLPLARSKALYVIEDSAQCFLARHRGRLAGTIGNAGSFSFQGSKHMTTGGDGGMVVSDDEEYARNIRKAAVQGYRTLDAKAGSTMIPKDMRQDWGFERHDRMGFNFRMSAPQAALGLGQLQRLDSLVAARVYIASRYEEVIAEEKCSWLVPQSVPEERTHSYWCYTCKLTSEPGVPNWRDFRRVFLEAGGDGLYGMWAPVHTEPIFRSMEFFGSRDRSPNFDPRYKGHVKSYNEGDCPRVEALRPYLCQFKTSMTDLDSADKQVEALRSAIKHYR
jgi:perosamine synthetase